MVLMTTTNQSRVLATNYRKNNMRAKSGKQNCNQELMTSYGLTGLSQSRLSTHKYCPKVTQNCCSPQDENVSHQLWETQSRRIIEDYYETYLISLKYILGYSLEGIGLAEDQLGNPNSSCKEAATTFKGMNKTPAVSRDIYNSFVNSLEKIANIRKGFYCILCDAENQQKLADYWSSVNLFYSDRVYFSQEFCRKLVQNTIRASYFKVFYLKKFSENLSKMIACQTGDSEVEYDIPFFTEQQVKNCYYFKDKFFFFFCERYCEKFHLTKPDSIFDGEIIALKKFYEQIKKHKNEIFDYPNRNVLLNTITYEEDLLDEKYKLIEPKEIFFKATTERVQLDKFITDVVYYGGMDPWDSSESSDYQLVLASVNLVGVLTLFLLMF